MLTDELVEDIKREEGFVAKVYLDGKRKKTIGYGTLLEDGISQAEAELLLRHRLGLMAGELERSRVGEVYANLETPRAARGFEHGLQHGCAEPSGFQERCGPR